MRYSVVYRQMAKLARKMNHGGSIFLKAASDN